MAEAAAIGVPPHRFWRMTPRELYAAFVGYRDAQVRLKKTLLWQAWSTANFTRAKKLPDLKGLLSKLEPSRVMSPRELRSTLLGIATVMGAKVIYKKRGDP